MIEELLRSLSQGKSSFGLKLLTVLMAISFPVYSEPNFQDFQQFHTGMIHNGTVDSLQEYQQQLSTLLQQIQLQISQIQNSTDYNITTAIPVDYSSSNGNDSITDDFITDSHTVEKRDVNGTTVTGDTDGQTTSTQVPTVVNIQDSHKSGKQKPMVSTHYQELLPADNSTVSDLIERQNCSDATLLIAQVFPEILPTEDSAVTTAPTLEKTLKIPTEQLKQLEEIRSRFNATKCLQLTQEELVRELKDRGTFNPDFMAWDVRGVLHFLEKMSGKYEVEPKSKDAKDMTLARNVEALEQLLKELNLQGCNANSPEFITKLYNFTRDITDSTKRYGRLRSRRDAEVLTTESRLKYLYQLYSKPSRDESSQLSHTHHDPNSPEMIGTVHYVPFGCKRRGSGEDGYLRMCGSCQAIRRLPDDFFPPFINEVACDEDKACLYFYDYPHGKCKQKHMSFVVLKNVGTVDCQIWRKFNINIRVCCECFVDENSFFAKYV